MLAENDAQPLPEGWVWTTIGEITRVIRGASPRPKGDPRYFGGNIPWIKISDVTRVNGKYVSQTQDTVTEEGAKKSRYLSAGVLILSNSGTVCVPKILAVDGCIHDGFVAFPDLTDEVDILHLYYYFEHIRPRVIQENRQGITQVNLNTTIVKELSIPLPPLPEQRRIVAEIETQFTRLDAAVAALERTQANLRRYKATVLQAACEGRLVPTEAELARAEGRDYEPADQLLARILAERRTRWEAEHLGKRYKEPAPPDKERLSEVPEGWVWASVAQLAENIQYGYTESAKDDPVGPKFLRITDIQDGRVNWHTVPYCECPEEKHAKYHLEPGDIVFARTGATTGKSYLIVNCPDAVFASYLIRLQMNESLNVKYLALFLDSPLYWPQIMTVRKGSAQPGVNATILATLHVPLPPLPEQHRIVAEVDRRLSLVAALEASVEAALVRAGRLRQAVLKQAFEGRLVPQDPDDEPASVLLERIRAEREVGKKGGGTNRKRKQPQQLQLPLD